MYVSKCVCACVYMLVYMIHVDEHFYVHTQCKCRLSCIVQHSTGAETFRVFDIKKWRSHNRIKGMFEALMTISVLISAVYVWD